MIRNLLVLLVFLGVSFGAGIAQSDIFVRQTPQEEAGEEETPKKRSIFLRPFSKNDKRVTAQQNLMKSRLNTEGIKRQIEQDLKTVNYWKKRDVGPRNLEEHRSYAYALRADARAIVLEQQEKARVRAANIKANNDAAFMKRLKAETPDFEGMLAEDAMILAERSGRATAVKSVYKSYGATTPSSSKPKVQRIYRKQDSTPEKPVKVFRDYR